MDDALKRRGSPSIWFEPEMPWHGPAIGKRGCRPEYSDAAIQICLTMKVLFGMSLRQATGFVESLQRLAGLDWKVPDFSTLCRRQKTLNVAIPYRGVVGPLHLSIDATGITAEGEGEWNARKHGGPKKRLWRKLHLGMDEETLQIRAVGVTTSSIGDAPMLPNLLDQIPPDQEIATVTAPSRQHPADSPAGQWMALMTRADVTMLLLFVEPRQSSPRAKMLNSGNQPRRAQSCLTKP